MSPMPRKQRRECKLCNKECSRPEKFYCNNFCQREFEYRARIALWKGGKLPGYIGKGMQIAPWLRRYLFEKFEYKCKVCGWNEVHPTTGRLVLEVNHIDGNAANCHEDNLEVLCPNHHALTTNFRALNKVSKRDHR